MGGLITLNYQPSQMVIGAILAAALALTILGIMAAWRPASVWLRDQRLRLTIWRYRRRTPGAGRVWIDDKEITNFPSVISPPKAPHPFRRIKP